MIKNSYSLSSSNIDNANNAIADELNTVRIDYIKDIVARAGALGIDANDLNLSISFNSALELSIKINVSNAIIAEIISRYMVNTERDSVGTAVVSVNEAGRVDDAQIHGSELNKEQLYIVADKLKPSILAYICTGDRASVVY